jgi:hypothetical protein
MMASAIAPSAPALQYHHTAPSSIISENDLFAGLTFPEVPSGPLVYSPQASTDNQRGAVMEDAAAMNTVEPQSYSALPALHSEEYASPQIFSPPSAPLQELQSPPQVQQVEPPRTEQVAAPLNVNFSKLYQNQEVSDSHWFVAVLLLNHLPCEAGCQSSTQIVP